MKLNINEQLYFYLSLIFICLPSFSEVLHFRHKYRLEVMAVHTDKKVRDPSHNSQVFSNHKYMTCRSYAPFVHSNARNFCKVCGIHEKKCQSPFFMHL